MSDTVHQKSWFGRNWIWVVPVGGCLTVILLFIFGIGAAVFGATKLISNATPYQYALEEAENNSEVLEILGEPIETVGIMQGNISINQTGGKADIKIPIKGPKGRALIVVKATKDDGDWDYEELYVRIKESKEKINLLDKNLEGF